MKVKIETITHNKQRYDTVGDYQLMPDGEWYISVSETGNSKYDFLIAIHELIELYLTQFNGISEESIMDFDLYFEKKRQMGFINDTDEPGFCSESPYRKEHTIATAIEMMLAAELGVDWKKYDDDINQL